jgi:hypothetical protein
MKRSIITAIALGACAPDVPDTPSYQQHVAPIFAANCVRCHGVPVLGGAPPSFRLDAYENYERPKRNNVGLETIAGAAQQSTNIALRVANESAPMPPRFGLDDYQIETLQNWDEAGAPRGAPNPGNRAPTAAALGTQRTTEEDGAETRVRYLIDVDVRDPDPDVVGGLLRVQRGTTLLPVGLIHSGPNRVAWETTAIPSGTFQLEAVLDDGAAEIVVPLGNIDVQ